VSPRRRLVLVLALLVLLASAVAGAIVLRTTQRGTDAVPQARPGPVLLVPGYGGGVAALEQLAEVIRAEGRQATVLRLPSGGTGPLAAQARVLEEAAGQAVAAGAPSVDVVALSAGGVVARLWVAEQGGRSRARRVVTLGSPHHGTDVAALAAVVSPGSCPAACRELAPDSGLLGRLNRGDETPPGPRWVSIWTTDDEVVTPPSSARLGGALDLVVQEVCPGRRVGHGELPTDPAVQALVLDAVAVAAPSTPPGCPVRS